MSNGRLLIVDDEPELLEILTFEFKGLDLEIKTAGNGFEALDVVKHFSPDAILCDMSMPRMDGMDLLIELHELNNYVPLLFLTGNGDKALAIRALKHGAFDFHEKPYQHDTLVSSVGKAIALGRELRTIEAELDLICAGKDLAPEALKEYRAVQRFLLRNRKHINTLIKKAA